MFKNFHNLTKTNLWFLNLLLLIYTITFTAYEIHLNFYRNKYMFKIDKNIRYFQYYFNYVLLYLLLIIIIP